MAGLGAIPLLPPWVGAAGDRLEGAIDLGPNHRVLFDQTARLQQLSRRLSALIAQTVHRRFTDVEIAVMQGRGEGGQRFSATDSRASTDRHAPARGVSRRRQRFPAEDRFAVLRKMSEQRQSIGGTLRSGIARGLGAKNLPDIGADSTQLRGCDCHVRCVEDRHDLPSLAGV